MKDFIKWLGVNEKVAKVVVWLLLTMICLIIINTCLESLGLPYYAITYENIKNINTNVVGSIICDGIVCILNFYAIILLAFRTKEIKPIFKYALLYTILSWIINKVFGYTLTQIYIISFIILFCYLYSNKNKKYIIYGTVGIIVNMLIQGIAYNYKLKFVNYTEIGRLTQAILSIDYFIIMAVIILVKEIYLKKRGEKNARNSKLTMVGRIQK